MGGADQAPQAPSLGRNQGVRREGVRCHQPLRSLLHLPRHMWVRGSLHKEHPEAGEGGALPHPNQLVLKTNDRRPYAQVDSVDMEKAFCGTCTSIPGVANPGCGCSNGLVAELAGELQERKMKRGMTAQLKTQENVMNEVLKLGVKVDLLLDHFANRSRAPPKI